MNDFPDPEVARKFVQGKSFSLKEIQLVRAFLKKRKFIPGLPKLTPEAVTEVEKILSDKEKELRGL